MLSGGLLLCLATIYSCGDSSDAPTRIASTDTQPSVTQSVVVASHNASPPQQEPQANLTEEPKPRLVEEPASEVVEEPTLQLAEEPTVTLAGASVTTTAAPTEPPQLPLFAPQREKRHWVDITGKFSVTASLVDAKGDTAYLQREDGRIAAVPLAKLRPGDKAYIASQMSAKVIEGKVTGVHAGDLLAVKDDDTHRVRLAGIDAPEKQQSYEKESRKALSTDVFQKTVRIEWKEKDADGKIIGDLILDSRWINKELVDKGWAWNRGGSPILAKAEAKAKEAKLGLWAESNPTPPWEFDPTPPPKPIVIAEKKPKRDSFRQSARYSAPEPRNSDTYSSFRSSFRSSPPRSSYSGGGGTVHVRGYTRKDGTYVAPHTRRAPRR